MLITLDGFELTNVSGGRFRLDGGTMFGVVPKPLWERRCPADERNRIAMETNCLLMRGGGRTVLIDTGYGSKADEKQRDIFALEAGDPLVENLAAAGVRPDDVDMVILTHLHFDHAGGVTTADGAGGFRPTFPRARHIVQRSEWEDATGDRAELAGAYNAAELVPIEEAGLLETVDGEAELLPGVSVEPTGGHTRGHQIVRIGPGEERAVYLGDLCPTTHHFRALWSMAYDQYPLDVRQTKPGVLGEIAGRGWLALFDHDPEVRAAYLQRDPKQEFVVQQAVEL